MEYLLVVGFAFAMLIPLLILYNYNSTSFHSDLALNQVYKVGKNIVDASQKVYYLGKPARTTIEYYMPEGVVNYTYENKTLLFTVRYGEGEEVTQIPIFTEVNITGSMKAYEGNHRVVVIAEDNYVRLQE